MNDEHLGADRDLVTGPGTDEMDETQRPLQSVESVCDRLVGDIEGHRGKPLFVLSVTGFPALGKTTITRRICARSHPDQVLSLEAEAWMLPYQKRRQMGVSGSSAQAYEVDQCCRDLESLLAGDTIRLGTYSHATGLVEEGTHEASIRGRSMLVLDGTLFSIPALARCATTVTFLAPADVQKWYEHATTRDVAERQFSSEEASRHNQAKWRDMVEIWRCSSALVTCTLIAHIMDRRTGPHIVYRMLSGAAWEPGSEGVSLEEVIQW